MDSDRVVNPHEARRTASWRKWALGAIALLACTAVAVLPVLHRTYSRFLLRTCLTDAQGLREGAEVRFAGVHIGFVREVRARPDNKQCPADVEMAIGPGYDLKIPSDSTVSVETAGVLGAAFLDIDARTASGPAIKNHGVLSSRSVPMISPEEIIKTLAKSLGRCPCGENASQAVGKDVRAP